MIRFPHSHSLSTPSFFLSARLGQSQIHNHDYILHSSQQSTYRTHCTLHNFFHDMFNAKILKYTGNDHTSGDNFFPYDIIASRPALCNSASLQLQLCPCSSTVSTVHCAISLVETTTLSSVVQFLLMELQLRAPSLFCFCAIPLDGTTTIRALSLFCYYSMYSRLMELQLRTPSLFCYYVIPIDRTLTMGSLSALLLCNPD